MICMNSLKRKDVSFFLVRERIKIAPLCYHGGRTTRESFSFTDERRNKKNLVETAYTLLYQMMVIKA